MMLTVTRGGKTPMEQNESYKPCIGNSIRKYLEKILECLLPCTSV